MDTKAFPYISSLGILWGTNLVVSRFGIGQFDAVLFVGLRLALASLTFVIVYLVVSGRRWPIDGRLWRHAVLLGAFGTALPMTSIISSLQYQSSGVTAVFVTAAPAITVLMAHFLLPDERLNRYKSLGVVLALGGTLLLVVRGESGLPDVEQANPLGYGLVFLGLISESSMAIYVRTYMRQLNAFTVTCIRLTTAALLVLPLALLLRGADFTDVTSEGVLSLGYAALAGTVVAQFLAFYITREFGATAFSLTAYVIPIVAAVTGVLLLGEMVTLVMVAGMILVGVGVLLVNKRG
jgi:drug/metabolite transporter (DMT)-like permease